MKIRLENLDTYKEIMVKVLLDSKATKLFINIQFAKEQEFKIYRLERDIPVKNVHGTKNSGGSITCEIEINLYYKR